MSKAVSTLRATWPADPFRRNRRACTSSDRIEVASSISAAVGCTGTGTGPPSLVGVCQHVAGVSPRCHHVSRRCHQVSQKCRGCVVQVSQRVAMCRGCVSMCRDVSRCRQVSRMCRDVSRCVAVCRGCVADVSRMCRGCVADVSTMCHRCVIGVSTSVNVASAVDNRTTCRHAPTRLGGDMHGHILD